MRSRNVMLAALLGFLLSICLTPPAFAYHTNFQGGCANYSETRIHQKRSYARSYAYTGRYEGYQWGGGCWNDNDRDDAPGDPVEKSDTRGEGGDCSGFTTKTWEINTSSSTAFLWREMIMNYHGPQVAASFRSSTTAWTVQSRTYTPSSMDSFASTGHVAMWYAMNSDGSGQFIEAKSESSGTGIWTETYRASTSFVPAARNGWTPECYPQCVV